MLDYVFRDDFCFPFNYGFVPNTRAQDGDPIDVVVLSSYPLPIYSIVKVKLIGILKLKDRGEQDDKLLGVPEVDPLAEKLNDIHDLQANEQADIAKFFKQVGIQKNKIMEIEGFFDKNEAAKTVQNSVI